MMYVIYRTSDSKIFVHPKSNKTHYSSERLAKSALTKSRNSGYLEDDKEYKIEESVYYGKNIEQYRMVKNIMSGVEVKESVNTPYYLSVGSESYWSA